MNWYPLNTWMEKGHRSITALLLCAGPQDQIEKFFRYIEKISETTERISERGLIHVRKMSSKSAYYDALYDSQIIFSKPILHKNGLEHTELCSWSKEPLTKLLLARRHDKDTEVLELQTLSKTPVNDLYLVNVTPSLTNHQHEIFQFALKNGYYNHPRKITLDELAKLKGLSKSAFHDCLRRAESHMLKEF